jgi:hypothetical protein
MSCNSYLFFDYFCSKNIFFESGIIFKNCVGFPFRTSILKNDLRYIKYMWKAIYFKGLYSHKQGGLSNIGILCV